MLVASVFLISYMFSNISSDLKSVEERQCEDSDGVWKEFSNTCGDSCDVNRRSDIICGQAFTFGCDCGEDMCWNGDSCVNI